MTENTQQQEAVKHITGPQQFSTEVETFDGIALVDFRAPRCGPCRMLGPTIEEIAQQYKNNPQVKIIKVDTEHPANLELAMRYQISSIPNVQIFKWGKVVENIVGLRQKKDYQDAIEYLLQIKK